MITWKEAIPILADKFGIPPKTSWVLDRSLANAGLRRKHKGPNPPAYGREEALAFLMACAMARHGSTKAAEIVSPWLQAGGYVTALPSNFYKPDPAHDEEFGEEYSGPIFTTQLEEIVGENTTFSQFMLALMSDFENESEYVPLTITLSEVRRTIEIETDGGFIAQTFYATGYDETGGPSLDIPPHEECAIEHKTIIYWHSIQAIIKRTPNFVCTNLVHTR
jgi:hypothetical protein